MCTWDHSEPARPQPADGVSYAPKLSRAGARVNWSHGGLVIDRLIRACTPAPGAWTTFGGASLKLAPVSPGPELREPGPQAAAFGSLGPGELRVTSSAVLAGTGTDPVLLGEVQPEGKRKMAAADWARGLRNTGPLVLS